VSDIYALWHNASMITEKSCEPCKPRLTDFEAQQFIAYCNHMPIDDLASMLRNHATVYEMPDDCGFLHRHTIMTNIYNLRTGSSLAHWR
jgi:hypothetical protein